MIAFLGHLSWSFFGVIGSGAILFVIGISTGRVLGPVEYGKYGLCITLANMISVMADFGFDQATLKFTPSDEADKKKQGRFFSISFRITLTTCVAALIILVTGAPFLSNLTGLDRMVLIIAGPYAFMSGTRQSLEAFIRARGLFKNQALIKLLEAVITLVLFLLIVIGLKHTTFGYYTSILAVAGMVTMLIYAFRYAKPYFGSWNPKTFLTMRNYAVSSVYISMIGLISLNIDRFFLNRSLGPGEVGIYSAYLLVPSTLATYFTAAFVNVFFPTMTGLSDKAGTLKKANKLGALLFVPIITTYFLLGWFVLRLLGSQYRFEPLYLLMTSVYGALLIYVALLAAIIGSSQKMFISYARFLILKLVIILAIYTTLSYYHRISIPALLWVLILAVGTDIFLLLRSMKVESGTMEVSNS